MKNKIFNPSKKYNPAKAKKILKLAKKLENKLIELRDKANQYGELSEKDYLAAVDRIVLLTGKVFKRFRYSMILSSAENPSWFEADTHIFEKATKEVFRIYYKNILFVYNEAWCRRMAKKMLELKNKEKVANVNRDAQIRREDAGKTEQVKD